jgi:hypothetical protein
MQSNSVLSFHLKQTHAPRFSLLLGLCAMIFSSAHVEAAPLSPPPKAAQYISTKMTNSGQLSKSMSKSALETMLAVIRERKCPLEEIAVYSHPKRSGKAIVVTVACYPPLDTDVTSNRYYAYDEYPLTFIVRGDTVSEVDFSKYGFEFKSGSLSFITDLDGNDMPEFWLLGYVCECDGPPEYYGPEGCDCDGNYVVEFQNGSLRPWKNRKAVKVQ